MWIRSFFTDKLFPFILLLCERSYYFSENNIFFSASHFYLQINSFPSCQCANWPVNCSVHVPPGGSTKCSCRSEIKAPAWSLQALERKTMISWDNNSQLTPTTCSSHSCHETNRLLHQLYQGWSTTIHLAKLHTWQKQACRDTCPKDWKVPSLVLEMCRSHALHQLGLQAWKFSAMPLDPFSASWCRQRQSPPQWL